MAQLSPASVNKTGFVFVKPTLQIIDDRFPRVFALGDVADTGAVKMGRAGIMQAEIVRDNIMGLIAGKKTLKKYQPQLLEGILQLSLGMVS